MQEQIYIPLVCQQVIQRKINVQRVILHSDVIMFEVN